MFLNLNNNQTRVIKDTGVVPTAEELIEDNSVLNIADRIFFLKDSQGEVRSYPLTSDELTMLMGIDRSTVGRLIYKPFTAGQGTFISMDDIGSTYEVGDLLSLPYGRVAEVLTIVNKDTCLIDLVMDKAVFERAEVKRLTDGVRTSSNPTELNKIWTELNNIPVSSSGPISTDGPHTVIMIGASITNHSTSSKNIPLVQTYIRSKYGREVNIINEATSGWKVEDLQANCEVILDKYRDQPDTSVFLHIGGGNIGTKKYEDYSDSIKDTLVNGLDFFYAAAEERNLPVYQAALTFRNYEGTTLVNDPELQKDVDRNSYSFTEGFIVEVMKERAPHLLKDDWPLINMYDLTRNMYAEWPSPDDPTDRVHPGPLGQLSFLLYAIESIVNIIEGGVPTPIVPRNFDLPTPKASNSLDAMFGFALDSYKSDEAKEDNINWTIRNRATVEDVNDVHIADIIDVNGNPVEGITLTSWVNDSLRRGVGNTTNPDDASASMTNNTLLLSALGAKYGNGYMGVIIDGLEPYSEYTVEATISGTGAEYSSKFYTTTGDLEGELVVPDAPTPETSAVTLNGITDRNGKLLVISAEVNINSMSAISGLRITS